jgi:indolepyruvate ferredoxin oxidoreductase beta subunit
MKLVEKEIGKYHVSCDIGCHLFSILPPFDIGNTTMGYGLGWAGASAFGADARQRTVAVMGDGGFWHNGLTSGVGNAVFNKSDNVLVIIDNGYSAATGGQDILSSRAENKTKATNNPIAAAVRGVGVKWVRQVNTYDIGRMKRVLKEAMTTAFKGPKIIIAQAECMLNRQRREKPLRDKAIREGKRVLSARYGVDPDTCTGDHSCIRLSGCPSLTIRDNPDPLRDDPVAFVNNDCVGCGVCGENAHAAVLCPSFYRAELIYNPSLWDRFMAGVRATAIGWMQGGNRERGIGNRKERRIDESALRRAASPHPHSPFPVADSRPIKIAVMALGGQGGGVLAEWIVKAGEAAGFIAQSTSVPGVAQRTGATIYYVELFPKRAADEKGAAPVLALMPTPGDVDVVIAAELMEAGRALARGFLSDRTILIASTHRVYAIGEKIAMGDGRQDGAAILEATARAAGCSVSFDMERTSEESGAVISAVMLGALAGSGATPIARETFEETIRAGGRAIERNLKGFTAGYDAAASGVPASPASTRPHAPPREGQAPALAPLVARIDKLPESAKPMALLGLEKVVDFQDEVYGARYLDQIERFQKIDEASGGAAKHYRLSKDIAKYLALAMAYDDVIRVADLKTRKSRFARFRADVRAADGQIVRVFEYMHPRVEEACDLLPAPLATAILNSDAARKLLSGVLGKGRRVATTNVSGFLLLKSLASLRFLRRAGSRYAKEQARIGSWLGLIERTAARDYALACEIAGLQRLVKGYGETHERGLRSYEKIAASLDHVAGEPAPAATLARLKDCALQDEQGRALDAALSKLGVKAAA